MVKRGTVLLLVVVLAAITGATVPRDAQAFGEPSPYTQLRSGGTSSSFWNAFKGLLTGKGPVAPTYGTLVGGESTTTARGVESMLYRARVGSRFLPRMGLVVGTRLTIVGTAAYIGWRVYQHYQGDDTTYDMWIDAASLGRDALRNPCTIPTAPAPNFSSYSCGNYRYQEVSWASASGPECSPTGSSDCLMLEFVPCAAWDTIGASTGYGPCSPGYNSSNSNYLQSQSGVTAVAQFKWSRSLDVDECLAVGAACYANWGFFGTAASMAWLITKSQENLIGRAIGGGTIVDAPTTVMVGGAPITAHKLMLRADALGTDANLIGSGTLTSPNLTTDYTPPVDAGDTTADATAALDAFDSVCGRALINHLLNPTFYPWVPGCIETAPASEPEAETLTLLRPLSTETYADYIIRLQTEGWLGTATLVELDPYDPSIGPEAVSKIGVTGTTGTWRRALWPATWPQIALDTDLTIYHNPSTAPPVAPDPTDEEAPPGGGDVFDPGGCEPWLEASPDFTPLTSLTFGNKFPFGLFAWVGGVLGSMSVVADAPNWDFHIVIPATSVSSETDLGHFVVDLDWADSYMSTVRLILTFVLWVGAVWFFATSLLGLRAPGNPAEAVDEA